MSTVELRGVTKVHWTAERGAAGGVVAVDSTDLTIHEGELFVLIGPSGCGKSTLLRIVAGIDRPTSGEVRIDGELVNDVDAHGRDVAMTFQTSALYPHLSVAENIGFSLRLAKERRHVVRRRVREAATLVSVDHLLERWPRQLSGGERQRVAMARMFVRCPHLFLMDEPMSELDAKLRTELRSEIVRLQRRVGVTTVYVTHDQVEAMSMGHRVAVMRRGRIVQCGTPAAVYERPYDLFVAQFLGSPPMNAWLATTSVNGDVVVLRWGQHELHMPPPVASRYGGADALRRREVVVGLRPEAFRVDAAGPLTVSPRFTESLGPQHLLHCTVGATAVRDADDGWTRSADHFATIVVAVPTAVGFDVWQPLHLDVDLDQLHLFDPVDGVSLRERADPGPQLHGSSPGFPGRPGDTSATLLTSGRARRRRRRSRP